MFALIPIKATEIDLWRRWFSGQSTFEETMEALDQHYPLVCVYDDQGNPLRNETGQRIISKGVANG